MGEIPVFAGRRRAEIWRPFDLGIDVSGTAWVIQVVDTGTPLRVSVILEPTYQQYRLEFDRMDVIAYTVGTVDRINHVNLPDINAKGGIYIVTNSDFHERESEWEGQYTAAGTHHLAIPAVDLTIEILTLELPKVMRLKDVNLGAPEIVEDKTAER